MVSRSAVLGFGAACLLALPAQAVTVGITTDATVVDAGPVLVPPVTFEDMADPGKGQPSVTATWANNTSETLTWGLHSSPTCGGVVSNLFSLGGCGDTWDQIWHLDNLNTTSLLTELVVDLTNTWFWFDRTPPDPEPYDPLESDFVDEGTPRSQSGRDFEFVDADPSVTGDISVEYSVIHGAQVGDAWRVMTVDFTGLTGGGVEGQLRFRQDVDSVIPVPAALPLLITGIGLLALFRRRRPTA